MLVKRDVDHPPRPDSLVVIVRNVAIHQRIQEPRTRHREFPPRTTRRENKTSCAIYNKLDICWTN